MSAIDLPTILVGLLALLLAGALGYVAWLARKLQSWRAEADELRGLLAAFDASVERAEAVLAASRAGAETGAKPDATADRRGEALRDDLAFLMERGSTLADRLEQDLRLALTRGAPRKRAAAQLRLVKTDRSREDKSR